jgi:hypothetical protein
MKYLQFYFDETVMKLPEQRLFQLRIMNDDFSLR